MENEQRGTILSMMFNTLLIVCALYGGTVIQNYTLICFGYFVLCDLIEDFLAFISSTANMRRASKKHPFGYGKEESYSSLAVGIIFVFLGVYIFTSTLHVTPGDVNIFAIFLMFGCALLRYINSEYQFDVSKKEQSQMLMSSAKDGIIGTFAAIIGLLIVLIKFIWPFADIIGALIMSILIILEGLKIVVNSILYISGQNDTSTSINGKIKKVINKEEGYNYINVDLVNVRNYYYAIIDIEIDDDISIIDLVITEIKLRRTIKKETVNVRFIEFEIYKAN